MTWAFQKIINSLFTKPNLLNTTLDIETISKNINRLESIDLHTCPYDDLLNLVKDLVKGYLSTTVIFPKGGSLFRAIPYGTKPHNFDYLSYPPSNIARQNRANRHGVPVLYCSTTKGTPLFEVKPAVGSYVALVQYKIEKNLEVAKIGFTDSNFESLKTNREVPHSFVEKNELCLTDENKFLENYLAKTFSQNITTDKIHLYKLTTAIADVLIRHNHIFGLVYPSIAAKGERENIVIKKSFIDEGGIGISHVEWVKITSINEDTIDIFEEDFARDFGRDKSIYWKGGPGVWETPLGFEIKESDGLQIVVDANNHIVRKY
ncbi:hypothetical protein GCM10027037_25350 [Mucilaginibacter koreensis]